jgi:hypothetical protein
MKIKHYTFFTETHRIFLKYFLNTFPFDPQIDLVIRFMPQECQTGEFENHGWMKTMTRKVEYILDAFAELKDGDIFIHSDADIVFLQPYKNILLEELGDHDIAFQSDVGTACMGFFVCRVSKKTKKLFNTLLKELGNHKHDQHAVNYLLTNSEHKLKTKLLTRKFFNYGFNGKHYKGESSVILPLDIILLHANFTVGIDNKVKLLQTAIKQKQ